MEKLSAKNLKGIWATVLLPLNNDDTIDFGCLEDELDIICNSGVAGVYTNGTAGEFYNQTENEFDRITLLVAEKCQKEGKQFQIGASHTSPNICLERIRRALALQPGAFQVIFPEWLPLTAEEQIVFLKKVVEIAAPVPVVLYNPGHSKTVLQPADYSRLSGAIPELIGIKVAAAGAEWYEEMKKQNMDLSVFIQGHRLATGIKEKVAVGSYSNIACLSPTGAVACYRLMLEDMDEALQIEKKILAFFEACIFPFAKSGYSDPALDKLLAFTGGWSNIGTRLRWPYKWVNKQEALLLQARAKKILPEIITKSKI